MYWKVDLFEIYERDQDVLGRISIGSVLDKNRFGRHEKQQQRPLTLRYRANSKTRPYDVSLTVTAGVGISLFLKSSGNLPQLHTVDLRVFEMPRTWAMMVNEGDER